jgi:hypothetical protein
MGLRIGMMGLKELKKMYSELAGKFKLPSFTELNENFEIEKIRKGEDTLLRTVRKTMMEKIVNTMGFLEFLLNPVNAPRAYFMYVKSMTSDDKKEIDVIYNKLSDVMLAALKLEIDYSEKGEAEMITNVLKVWNDIKPGMRKIMKDIEKPNSFVAKEKSYFG